jgi:hypothetical protein
MGTNLSDNSLRNHLYAECVMTRLLHDRIQDLHLNADAPFPSEMKDGHDMVLQWRRFSKLRLVPCDHRDAYSDGDDTVDDGEVE